MTPRAADTREESSGTWTRSDAIRGHFPTGPTGKVGVRCPWARRVPVSRRHLTAPARCAHPAPVPPPSYRLTVASALHLCECRPLVRYTTQIKDLLAAKLRFAYGRQRKEAAGVKLAGVCKNTLRQLWRLAWMQVFNEPAWRPSVPGSPKMWYWLNWLTGWAWTLVGLVLGAFIAPSLVHLVGLSNTPYQDYIDISVSVLAGFLVRFLGWCLYVFLVQSAVVVVAGWMGVATRPGVGYGALISAAALPLAGVGYALYRYLHWVGAGQERVTTAFVGGFLIKAIVTGAALKWVVTRLRGRNAPKPG